MFCSLFLNCSPDEEQIKVMLEQISEFAEMTDKTMDEALAELQQYALGTYIRFGRPRVRLGIFYWKMLKMWKRCMLFIGECDINNLAHLSICSE